VWSRGSRPPLPRTLSIAIRPGNPENRVVLTPEWQASCHATCQGGGMPYDYETVPQSEKGTP
jgi:hypothetical protein